MLLKNNIWKIKISFFTSKDSTIKSQKGGFPFLLKDECILVHYYVSHKVHVVCAVASYMNFIKHALLYKRHIYNLVEKQ